MGGELGMCCVSLSSSSRSESLRVVLLSSPVLPPRISPSGISTYRAENGPGWSVGNGKSPRLLTLGLRTLAMRALAAASLDSGLLTLVGIGGVMDQAREDFTARVDRSGGRSGDDDRCGVACTRDRGGDCECLVGTRRRENGVRV